MIHKSLRLHRIIIHPLISVIVPSLFVVTLHVLLRRSLGAPAGFPDWLLILAPGASLAEAVAGNAVRTLHAGPHWRVREIALYLLGVTALAVTLGVALLHLAYLLPLCLLGWEISYALHTSLRSREEVLRTTELKQGAELARSLYQALLVEGDALVKLGRARTIVVLLHGSLLCFAALLAFAGVRLGVLAAGLLLLQALARYLVVATLNMFDSEQRLLGQNLRPTPAVRAHRLTHGALLLGLCLAAAMAVSRPTPLLRVERALELLQSIGGAFARRRRLLGPRAWELLERVLTWLAGLFPAGSAESPVQQTLPSREPSELVRRLLFAFSMTLLVAAVGLVLAFLVIPLTEAEFKEGLSRRHLLRFLRHRLRLIGRLALDALRAFRAALAELGRDSRAVFRAAARGRAGVGLPASWRQTPRDRAGATPARRRLLSARGRALRSFRALATWAARQGLAYREHLGALEYAREIARKLPDRGGSVQAAAQLLERILYSARQAAPEELSALERAVRSAIRGR